MNLLYADCCRKRRISVPTQSRETLDGQRTPTEQVD